MGRPQLDRAIASLHVGDALVFATLDRLGRSTPNMLELSNRLRKLQVGLKVLNLGGDAVNSSTPIESMHFTIMAALAQMELDTQHE